ncbi:pentapeptide repeat-containing protein [Campylobacter lari]|nr:pentapeptide repeat-containing protein [Campylobacter lari]EAK9945498.1 pentapeptide repeat-containing protein [Campylobacter lari]
MEKINIKLLKMRLHMEKDEKRRKEIEDILEKDDEELAKLYMKKYYKTIREKREEIANALKIKVDNVVYDKSEKFISGNRNKFEIYHKTIKHFDIYSLNGYEIDFYHCNIEFILSKGPSVYAENINFKNLYFTNCKISINIVDDFCCENIHFLNCNIYSLSFNKVIVKGNIKFSNSSFVNKSVFNSCIFQDSIYFNNSHFKDYVDFHECKFEKSACFYGVTFEKTPNFSACYFKEQKAVNLTNVNIDNLDFESVEKYIEDNYQDETYKNEIENIRSEEKEKINLINNKHQLRCAKNLKDSFRVIKDVFISQNNILEAQEWHKLELYTKEKETMIKATSINDNIDSKNTTVKFLKEELYNFTEWINFTLLFVYRNTSNHHTSFLKILNFTVVMIALYASFLFWLQNDGAIKSVYGFIVVLAFAAVIIIAFVSLITCKSIFKLRTSRLFLFVSMGYGIFLLLCFQTLEALIVCCYILLASSISLMFFYGKYSRFFIVAFAYIVFSIVLIEKPQFINPFIGVFSSEKLHESKIEKAIQELNSSSILNLAKISHKDFNLSRHYQDISFVELDAAKKLIVENKDNILDLKEQNLTIATEFLGKEYTEISKAIKQDETTSNVIKSTSVLYSIILLLCIFSLQKTARKNSIVPS